MKTVKLAVLALGIGLSSLVVAHSDEHLDTIKALNGGQMRMAGPYHYELVIKPAAKSGTNDVLVYLTDHAGKEIEVKRATGTATILAGGKTTVTLTPKGKNVLKGSGNFAMNPNLKAVVSIALPGKQAEQARFTPFAVKAMPASHKR